MTPSQPPNPTLEIETRPDCGADVSTAGVLGEYVSRQAARLGRLDPLVRADLPDAVHQMRVACRRLRGVLASCRRELDPARTQPVRDDLAWLVDELGRARDLEVLRDRVRATAAEPSPALDRIDAQLRIDHDRAHADAVEAMASPRYLALVDALRDLAADPPWSARATAPAEDELLTVLRAEWRRVRKAVRRASHSSGPSRARRLHDVRRAARRARYTAEAFAPVFGDRAVSLAQALAALQDVLGSHHDAIVTLRVLRDLDRQRPGSDAVHQLRDRLREDADRDDQRFQRLFDDLRTSPETRWLG